MGKSLPRLLIVMITLSVSPLASDLRVGAAAVSITPPAGTPLAGYYYKRLSEGVLDELYSKAVVIERDGTKVAIVVDDLTRHTPVSDLLPGLLKVIEGKRVPTENVTIVIGTGTHRPMDQKEIETRLGAGAARAYRVENHDAHSKDLVVAGELPSYGKISFNATVMKADVKITVGTIIPHVHNGFGGGPQNIMPAICNFDTVRTNHLQTALHARARVGGAAPACAPRGTVGRAAAGARPAT